VQLIDVRDLAKFILTLTEQGHGGVFNAVGPAGPLTFREMVDGCKAAVSAPIEFVPVSDAFLQAHNVGIFAGPESLPLWIPSGPDSAGHGTRNIERALAQGLTIRPLAQTAADTVAWFATTSAADAPFGTRAGLSPERETALLQLDDAIASNP
jgi:2'-hydroxyisoflavone reductase